MADVEVTKNQGNSASGALAELKRVEWARLGQLILLVSAAAGATYAASILSPMQEALRRAFPLSDLQISELQGPALYLPSIIAAVPIGYLLDRYSRSRLLAAFVAIDLVASLGTGFAPNFWMLLATRAVVGLMIPAIAMAVSALVGELIDAKWRGRALMLVSFGQIGGMAAAFGFGGKLIARFGGAGAWRMAVLWATAPILLISIGTFLLREPAWTAARQARASLKGAAARLWKLKVMVAVLSFGPVAMGVGYMAALVWAAPILMRRFGVGADDAGAKMALVLMVSALVGPALGGFASDRLNKTGGPRRLILLMAVLSLLEVPASQFAIAQNASLFVAILTCLSILFFIKGVICATLTIVVIPDELRGLCFGIQNVISGIVSSIAPVAVSLMAVTRLGPSDPAPALSWLCVATAVCGAVIFILGRGHFPGRATSTSASLRQGPPAANLR